ncbi:hypothetical protein CC78DRAFT_616257 [Lojkania enalia]|uniref:Uncharacterized protein n=1 Tax=Lojkania enalia TaxID=147567 RepID=A0A9P4KES6_9PLEO|nr:hypothetical protein CC78DRAFT_616257 [Didymosphaeria enalia]
MREFNITLEYEDCDDKHLRKGINMVNGDRIDYAERGVVVGTSMIVNIAESVFVVARQYNTIDGAYDDTFRIGDFDYIIHNASPLNFGANDIYEEIIRPAIEGDGI